MGVEGGCPSAERKNKGLISPSAEPLESAQAIIGADGAEYIIGSPSAHTQKCRRADGRCSVHRPFHRPSFRPAGPPSAFVSSHRPSDTILKEYEPARQQTTPTAILTVKVSSEAFDVDKIVYGSKVPVLDGEKLSIRSLVDHSIVESFAQGGRRAISSRIYPTKAINGAARLFVFNNATGIGVTASVKIWKMDSADIHPFPFDRV